MFICHEYDKTLGTKKPANVRFWSRWSIDRLLSYFDFDYFIVGLSMRGTLAQVAGSVS